MLNPDEVKEIDSSLKTGHDDYIAVSNYIMGECLHFRRKHPTFVRAVFSREPQLKQLLSITNKIEDERLRGNNDYGWKDIHDVIALTILVPFWSDTDRVI